MRKVFLSCPCTRCWESGYAALKRAFHWRLSLSTVHKHIPPTPESYKTRWLLKDRQTPGGHSNGKRGYQARPWAHKKHPNHVFSGMKIDPNYAFLHAFFLICPSCPFQNLSIWPKTHPFFQFFTLNAVRAYSAWSWKTTLITWIFGRAWYPPWHSSAPPPPGDKPGADPGMGRSAPPLSDSWIMQIQPIWGLRQPIPSPHNFDTLSPLFANPGSSPANYFYPSTNGIWLA